MMRRALWVFGWLSIIGSVADAAILAHHLILVGGGSAELMASVWDHIADHLPFLTWLRPMAVFLLPAGWADWLFALPAIGYFPVRILFSIITGSYALGWARRLRPASPC